jgi:DNA polymerase I-like protein with 3'-5' exonuclease and polymerase domains
MMLVAVDIETSCGVSDCPGFGLSNSSKCEHAVHFKQNRIDIIGTWDGENYRIFPTTSAFDDFRAANNVQVIGHGFKFDYKTLRAKGSKLSPRDVVGDTQLLASCVKYKIPKEWLAAYNEERKVLNEPLPAKQRHRVGSPLTLKTLAPYYLGVPKFWENPVSHDDPEYNRKDCEYTYLLHQKLMGLLDESGTRAFYESFLLPWSKLLAEAEYEGVLIDEVLLHRMYAEAVIETKKLGDVVHTDLADVFGRYRVGLEHELRADSDARLAKYIETRVKDPDKIPGVTARYEESLATKIAALPTQFNLQSSAQMLHVCKEKGIDVNVEKRDKESNEWIESEGTDKFILKRAKVAGGNEFAAKLLALRGKQTEVSYLKQYIEAVVDHRIHCTFNITGTRTGRLSSAGPNLQNVKGALRLPFVIADPSLFSIYTVDASQIEPRIIAALTADKEMVQLFMDGRDYHNYATKKFFPRETEGVDESDVKKGHNHLRKTAKIGDLSILYGTGKYTFQTMCLVREEMDIPLDQCDAMIQDFRAGMKGIMGWKRNLEENYKAGYPIFDRFGYLVQARDEASIHMTLFNTYVQGMASRLIFNASLEAYRHFHKYKIDAKPLLWVHDEVVWRFPKGRETFCKKVVDYFMTCAKLDTPYGIVPLEVEGVTSDRWQK